jgi:hypothetical protein
VDLVDLERRLLLDEVHVALAPLLLRHECDAVDGTARWCLWEPRWHLILGVGVVVGEGAKDEWDGGGVGGDGSVDGEVVDRHLIIDLLLGKVEVLNGEVGGVARGLRVGPRSRHRSTDEAELNAVLCNGETVVELSHLELVKGIEGEVCFLVIGLGQGGWQ